MLLDFDSTPPVMDKSPIITFIQKIEIALNVINHILIGFITIYMTWMCIRNGLEKTALHAWLCTLAYQFFMAEAILCFYSGNSWSMFSSRRAKTTVHLVLQIIAAGMGLGGVIFEIQRKQMHFYTIHGILGLIATIFLCLNILTGLSAFYAVNLRHAWKPIFSKLFHNFFGLLGFVLGTTNLYFGYQTGFMARHVEPDLLRILEVFTILTIFLTSIGPIISIYDRIKLSMMQ